MKMLPDRNLDLYKGTKRTWTGTIEYRKSILILKTEYISEKYKCTCFK